MGAQGFARRFRVSRVAPAMVAALGAFWIAALVPAGVSLAKGGDAEGSGGQGAAGEEASSGAAVPSGDGSGVDAEGAAQAGEADRALRPRVPSTTERPPAPRIFEVAPARGVLVVDIDGEITPGMAAFVTRAVRETHSDPDDADSAPAVDALIVRIDTFGGRVDSAVVIRDALLEAQVPVVAFVENRAISAGALIAYAADHIVFSPAASMGAATPIQVQGGEAVPVEEKVVSYMRAEMRATADANGRRTDVAEAMVDRVVVVDGVVNGETLLTVTTSEALALDVADGVSASLDALVAELGAGGAEVKTLKRNWAERLAMLITTPVVAGLLMSLGILGIWVEIKAPGFGAPGVIGILALAAFFFGHMVVHLAGWEEVILAAIGVVLLVVEIFFVPGFGVPGLLGLLCFVAAFVFAMVGLPIGVSLEIGALNLAAFRVFVSLSVALVGMGIVAKLLPERALPGWLVLRTAIDDESGAEAQQGGRDAQSLVGAIGTATTDLRPSGRAEFAGRLLDVVGRTDWIDKGTRVRVVEVGGVRIVVEALPAGDAAGAPAEAHAELPGAAPGTPDAGDA